MLVPLLLDVFCKNELVDALESLATLAIMSGMSTEEKIR